MTIQCSLILTRAYLVAILGPPAEHSFLQSDCRAQDDAQFVRDAAGDAVSAALGLHSGGLVLQVATGRVLEGHVVT
jgi:hypothetical protein